jgi:hypothetical protein
VGRRSGETFGSIAGGGGRSPEQRTAVSGKVAAFGRLLEPAVPEVARSSGTRWNGPSGSGSSVDGVTDEAAERWCGRETFGCPGCAAGSRGAVDGRWKAV